MAQVIFETPRLIARRLEPEDRQAMLAVYGDVEAMRYVGDGTPLSEEECDRWLVVTAENYQKRGYGMFALVERETGAIVGFCGLVHFAGRGEPEIKYALLRAVWGRGLATEAARAMLGYGAATHGLQSIIATVDPDNQASQRVLAKAGMQRGALQHEEDGTDTQFFHWRPPGEAAS